MTYVVFGKPDLGCGNNERDDEEGTACREYVVFHLQTLGLGEFSEPSFPSQLVSKYALALGLSCKYLTRLGMSHTKMQRWLDHMSE